MFIKKNDSPAITAWNPQNSTGAKNTNVNSIGSVIPVKKEVKAAGNTTAIACLRVSLGAAIIIASPAAGNANCMNPYLPCVNLPNLRLSWSEINSNAGAECAAAPAASPFR